MSEEHFVLNNGEDRTHAIRRITQASAGARVVIKQPKRTLDQNSKLWPILTEVATQATLNGEEYDTGEWKLLFLSALAREKREQLRIVRGLYGEPVNLGRSTSKLDKKVFSELIEIIHALGTELGVVFKDETQHAAP